MKITWFGESGFRIQSGSASIFIDPYFSDALGAQDETKHRIVPVDPAWFDMPCGCLLFTHWHIDHTDPETVRQLLAHHPDMIILGPPSSRELVSFAPVYVEMKDGDQASFHGVSIRALPAVHSDRWALGYEIKLEGKTLYFSGDTALLCNVQDRVPHNADAAFLCFNAGIGKNMNEADAVRMAKQITPGLVVPFHYGVIPGGVQPDLFRSMLEKENIPHIFPAIGETFEL